MQWLVAPTPRRLPVATTSDPVIPKLPRNRRPGVVTNSKATCGGAELGASNATGRSTSDHRLEAPERA
jgi:hypothetical protein